MITATTSTIKEREIVQTRGVVSGEAIIGAHIFRDLFAGISNIIGGRVGVTRRPCGRPATSPWTRCATGPGA
jgi:uncharacterized protein YbjQ (UPF0145 family)